MPAPDETVVTPDLAGFATAMDLLRSQTGHVITFFWPVQYVFGAEIPLSPESGAPYDGTASAMASAQASAQVTAAAFFKAINRGGAANANIASPVGELEKTRLFLNIASADEYAHDLSGRQFGSAASEFEFHGNRFSILSTKFDQVLGTYLRWLVYAAGEGNDE